ncbi:MAG: TIM barrel protein [Sedimentisphaerales bacterium]|nr:TIM barrel protein [Sedimentisphaerales bacterium]
MDRRSFLASSLAAGAALSVGTAGVSAQDKSNSAKFKLRYAPGFGTFQAHVGKDDIDNIKFAADQGFTAMFDNGLMGKSPEQQEKIAAEMNKLDMKLGPFVLYPNFGDSDLMVGKRESIDAFLNKVKEGLETCRRTGCKQMLVVPGRVDQRLEVDYQTANLMDLLRRTCEIVEKEQVVIVLEPLNRRDHPGQFLYGIPQTYMICKGVNHPCCKIVDDLYHQQITEGNLIPNIDRAWDQIAAFHIGDNPGRQEPGTGEINYQNVFKHIYRRKYAGVLCCEHGKSRGGKEGEIAFIEAYRWADNFRV